MGRSIYTVSIHTEDGSVSDLITGIWEQTFSNFDRANALYDLLDKGLAGDEGEYSVMLRTVTVTDDNEPYSLQLYNEDAESFDSFTFNDPNEAVKKILDALLGDETT